MQRGLKNFLKRSLFQICRLSTLTGFQLTPAHYYSSQPNLRELERTRQRWARRSALHGIAVNLDEQVRTLRAMCEPYTEEYRDNQAYHEGVSARFGPGYGYVEAQALHAVIRSLRPRRIVEVGSGVSTHCMLHALALNEQDGADPASLTCIEPYPSPRLLETDSIVLRRELVQTASGDTFLALKEGDFLFIDSSHTVKPGSDVNFLLLDVLPQLHPGVTVHIHDIYLPYDYAPHTLKTFFHWSETTVLRALLVNNPNLTIRFCLSQLHHDRQDVLKELFPGYNPETLVDGLLPDDVRPFEKRRHFPTSIYLYTT